MPCAAGKPSPRIRFTDGEIGLIGNLNGWKVSGVADFSPEELEKESSRKVTSEGLNLSEGVPRTLERLLPRKYIF